MIKSKHWLDLWLCPNGPAYISCKDRDLFSQH